MKKTQSIVFLFLIAALVMAVPAAHASTADARVPFQDDPELWGESACAFMTSGGCAYFRDHETNLAWSLLNTLGGPDVEARLVEKVISLDHGLELWLVEITLFVPGGSERYEAYATVESDTRLIDRVVVVDGTLVAGIGEQ